MTTKPFFAPPLFVFVALATSTSTAQEIVPNGQATKNASMFKMTYSVGININASADKVWNLLTDAPNIPTWNSTINSLEGSIAEGQKIRLVAAVAPDRTFKLKVKNVVPQLGMTWSDGAAPMFKGVRTFTVRPNGNGGVVFTMSETFSGLMLPMIKGSLPDFTNAFQQFAADLKTAAE